MTAIVQKISHRVRVWRIPGRPGSPAFWSWRCSECTQVAGLHWRWGDAYNEAAQHPYRWSFE